MNGLCAPSTAQPDPLPQPKSHFGIWHNGSVHIPGALGEPKGKADPSRTQALPGGSEQPPLWQRPPGPEYTGHTSEQWGRRVSSPTCELRGDSGRAPGVSAPLSQPPYYIRPLEPTGPTLAWGVGTMHIADCGDCLARVMGTAKVQGHSSGGGRIISPLLTGLREGGPVRRSGRECPRGGEMEKPKAV